MVLDRLLNASGLTPFMIPSIDHPVQWFMPIGQVNVVKPSIGVVFGACAVQTATFTGVAVADLLKAGNFQRCPVPLKLTQTIRVNCGSHLLTAKAP
jgi:hypothetical protein